MAMARVSKQAAKAPVSKSQGTAVGSGSRPTGGKIPIKTSAPTDPKGLGRKPAGALK
jgi:hypothetical protein